MRTSALGAAQGLPKRSGILILEQDSEWKGGQGEEKGWRDL